MKEMIKMEKIKVISFDDTSITTSCVEDLENLYSLIEKNEAFIITWIVDKRILSKLVYPSDMSSRIKNGELELKSVELIKC